MNHPAIAPANPYAPAPGIRLSHPEWSRNATIYQINTRQFTADGTIRAAENELPRLAELGAVIIWLMPIHPIGYVNRKGHLGSPYAVRDYYSVDPDLGTKEDLRSFVARAHELGLYVILDWVANHTAWDNPLLEEHPDWYARDWKGDPTPTPWWDWEDVIDLDYSNSELRRYMTEAMKFWVSDLDVDGYRCDVAGFVPTDFWNNVRRELDEIKPVFMLAEWESRDLHVDAFDMTYGWSWNETMHKIATGTADVSALHVYYSWDAKAFPPGAMRMTFVSNHDKNSWEGTEFEQFGDCLEAAVVLSIVGSGLPLIYNGQEAGYDKRLEFFERDPIKWGAHPMGDLYKNLFALKRGTRALWNGEWGATMIPVPNSDQANILSFVRRNEEEKIFAVFNFSDAERTVTLHQGLCAGEYVDHFSGDAVSLVQDQELSLPAWGYRLFIAR